MPIAIQMRKLTTEQIPLVTDHIIERTSLVLLGEMVDIRHWATMTIWVTYRPGGEDDVSLIPYFAHSPTSAFTHFTEWDPFLGVKEATRGQFLLVGEMHTYIQLDVRTLSYVKVFQRASGAPDRRGRLSVALTGAPL